MVVVVVVVPQESAKENAELPVIITKIKEVMVAIAQNLIGKNESAVEAEATITKEQKGIAIPADLRTFNIHLILISDFLIWII